MPTPTKRKTAIFVAGLLSTGIAGGALCGLLGYGDFHYRWGQWQTGLADGREEISVFSLAAVLLTLVGSILLGVWGPLLSQIARQRLRWLARTSWGVLGAGLAVLLISPAGPHSIYSAQSHCLNNLVKINAAKDLWALDTHARPGAVPADSDIFGAGRYLPSKPECPDGGAYRLNAIGTKPACTVAGHTLRD
jgi:hypothetical protein